MTGRSVERDEHGLTDLERTFIDLWMINSTMSKTKQIDMIMDLNENIGSRKGGSAVISRIKKNPAVIAYIDAQRQRVQRKVNYSQEKWFRDAVKLKEMAMGEKATPQHAVVKGVMVELIAVKKVDLAQAKAILELLGKSKFLQLFETKVKVDASEEMKKFIESIKPTVGPPALRKDNPDLKLVK